MNEIAESTVSMGDYLLLSDTVSTGDVYTTTSSDVVADAEVLAQLETTNFLLSALLFFTIFTWVEIRLRSAVRRLSGRE